jgi:hypothetical protein
MPYANLTDARPSIVGTRLWPGELFLVQSDRALSLISLNRTA